jgi:S1-C subfamily serine protease
MERYVLAIVIIFYGCDLVSVGIELPDNSNTGNIDQAIANEVVNKDSVIIETAKISTVNRLLSSTVSIYTVDEYGEESAGSGFFVAQGKIVTNYHVIEGASKISIKPCSDPSISLVGNIKKSNPMNDLALIEVDPDFKPGAIIPVSNTSKEIGMKIWVSGNPHQLECSLSEGIISGLRQPKSTFDCELIQISAPISPGSSGGPVVSETGQLIAVSVAGITREGAQNLNFAVPAKYVKVLLED